MTKAHNKMIKTSLKIKTENVKIKAFKNINEYHNSV